MSRHKDLTNQRFGRLTALVKEGRNHRNYALWRCRCDCGNEKHVAYAELKKGTTKSCGCLHVERMTNLNRSHGMSHSKEYVSWVKAKDRCFNEKHVAFAKYGGAGIVMCEEWRNSFEAFYAYVGRCPRGYTLDRIDNSKGYEPGNVRWASKKLQAQNSSWPKRITMGGITQNVSEWAAETGISKHTISRRINSLGWSAEQAVTTPPRKLRKRVITQL